MQKAIKRYFPVFVLPTMIAFTIGFIRAVFTGLFIFRFCKFTTVTDARFIGLRIMERYFRSYIFTLSVVYRVVYSTFHVIDQCTGICGGVGIDKTSAREKYFPDCIFYAEFDRWNYSGIYLAASVKRSACTLGKNTYIFRDLRLMGMIILVCWQQIGYMMIIYISGIQNIPGELIEAAKIDGATPGRYFARSLFRW